jgi:hypothetical protein
MDPHDELMGADLTEHHIRHSQVGVSRAVSALRPFYRAIADIQDIQNVGSNPGIAWTLDTSARIRSKTSKKLQLLCNTVASKSLKTLSGSVHPRHKHIKNSVKGNLPLLENLSWG